MAERLPDSRRGQLTALALGVASVAGALLTAAVVLELGGGASAARLPGLPTSGPVTQTRVTESARGRSQTHPVADAHAG